MRLKLRGVKGGRMMKGRGKREREKKRTDNKKDRQKEIETDK